MSQVLGQTGGGLYALFSNVSRPKRADWVPISSTVCWGVLRELYLLKVEKQSRFVLRPLFLYYTDGAYRRLKRYAELDIVDHADVTLARVD